MDEFNEGFIKKLKRMSKKEREEWFLNQPREKAASYKEIFMRVIELEDFYIIISKLPKNSFNSEFNKKIIELGGNPANSLKDYIILEIRKFYELAHEERNRFRFPNPPMYWEELKNIRHDRIAHADKKSKYNRDVEKYYEVINKIGFDNIVDDFKKYGKNCISLVNNSIFYDEALKNLKKMMEEGEIKLLNDTGLKKSLRRVKIKSDGSIIKSTVDGRIRALLLAIEAAKSDNKNEKKH